MTEVCIANIGPLQRRSRARLGLVWWIAAVVVAVVPYALGLDPVLRFACLPLVFGGFQGVLQSREKT